MDLERKDIKILLVSFFNDEAYGLRSLHATLIEDGKDARMLFFKIKSKQFKEDHEKNSMKDFKGSIYNATEEEIALFVDFVVSNKFNIIGFSLVSSHFFLYKKIYEKIKNIKGLTIVLGGWQPSLNPEECINFADFLCIGEGEESLRELVRSLSNNQPTDNLLNFWINKNGKIIKNAVRPLMVNLSSFPIPIFNHKYSYYIENNRLVFAEPYFENIRYGTFIGRGCPMQCTYCSNSYMVNNIYPGTWSKIRYRSIDHVKKEILTVKNTLKNVKSINFYDEIFTPNIEYVKDFFSWYGKEIKIPFFCFFFPGLCSEEKCKIMAEAGLKGVWIGVQSGSSRVRKEVFKRIYTNEQVVKQAEIFSKYGVSVRYDFIFDNPFELFEESLESIYLMLKLPQPFSVNLFSLKFFPNTEITKMAINARIVNKSDLDDNQKNDQDTYFIRQDTANQDNKFINHLAFYISAMSKNSVLREKEGMISGLIENYKKNKDLTPIVSLVKPIIK